MTFFFWKLLYIVAAKSGIKNTKATSVDSVSFITNLIYFFKGHLRKSLICLCKYPKGSYDKSIYCEMRCLPIDIALSIFSGDMFPFRILCNLKTKPLSIPLYLYIDEHLELNTSTY